MNTKQILLRAFVTSWFVAGLVSSASGQTAQPFRASTEAVEVDVVVQDKNGAFVGDLKIDDFEVLEEDRPQKIQQLYVHERPAATDAPRVFVVVFDEGHMSPAAFKRAQDAARLFFTEQFADGDLGGVVAAGHMANNRLSRDRQELLNAVRDAKPTLLKVSRDLDARVWPRVSETEAIKMVMNADSIVSQEVTRRACGEEPAQCRDMEADAEGEVQSKALQIAEQLQQNSTETLQVLKTLMEGLQSVDGRKSVLLMADGFMTDATWPLLKDTEAAAARAHARIYTLDARAADRSGGKAASMAQLLQQVEQASTAEAMNPLSPNTGGFAVRSPGVFGIALKQIASEAGSYYVLGYRPALLDGQYHALTVHVKRPLLAVRARKGYVASVTAAASTIGPISARPVEGVARPVEGIDTPASSDASAASETPAVGTTAAADAGATEVRVRPEASTHVAALQKNTPPNAAATAGWDAYGKGDLQAARTSLSLAAADPAARPWVTYALGHAQYALGDFDKAIAAWERVLGVAPEFEPVYFDLADGYMQLEDFNKAERVVRLAGDRWPQDADVYLSLGVIQAWRGTLDEAVPLFEKAIALAPTNAAAQFNLGKALELRYYGSRRYDDQRKTWIANEKDRENAGLAYQRCIDLGGLFADDAREGLARLEAMAR